MLTTPADIAVLLIDDDEDDYLLADDYLREAFPRHTLIWEKTGEAGLAALRQQHIDIILLDYFLGTENGIDVGIMLQQSAPAQIPIILLTGLHDTGIDTSALAAGIEDYLVKQELSAEMLARSIRHAMTRHQAKLELRDREEQLRSTLEAIHDAVLTLDEQGNIIALNPAAEAMFRLPSRALGNCPISTIIPDFVEAHESSTEARTIELTALDKHNKPLPIEVSLSQYQHAQQVYTTCVVRDITERKESIARIEHEAHYDSLTNLPNRRMLASRIDQALNNARRYQEYGALLFLDLDRFKALNDTLGHTVGDELLRQMANRLRDSLRDVDTIARLGGDEFVVLLSRLGEDSDVATMNVRSIAKKVITVLNIPYRLEGGSYTFTCSIGITLFAGNNRLSVDTLLHQADAAMYLAKENGRNQMRFYDKAIQLSSRTRLTLEHDLRQAVNNGEFFLQFQPHINHASCIIGCEALIRWVHPSKGLIMPGDFIPIAEESGVIVDIGKWVIEESLRHYPRIFGEMANHYIAVNVSSLQLKQDDFVEHLLAALTANSFSPQRLTLELTEGCFFEQNEILLGKLERLAEYGVRISIDDFGKGYSCLAYLKNMPVHQLKIDRSFIKDFISAENDRAIVMAILAMAHALKVDVIAEGVEDAKTYELLRNLGCEKFQGFYFCPGVNAKYLREMLTTYTRDNIVHAADCQG